MNHWAFLSIIIILTSLDYSNVLHGELVFDDKFITIANPQSLSAFKDMNLWDSFKSGGRPVTSFTFSLNYYLWGKDTFSYHLTNLVIHIINGILVYLFIYITVTLPSKSPLFPLLQRGKPHAPLWQRGVRGDFVRERWTAFLTALLFSMHPIQTESVSYIYQRAESLSSMFYLISLISFIWAARSSGTGRVLYLVFIAGFVIAFGSKEIAVTLPVVALLYGVYFFERKGVWKKIAIPGALILAGLTVAVIRMTSIDKFSTAGYSLKEFTAWEYLLTQISVVVTYLRLLIFPVGQSIDHGYSISRSIFEVKTILNFTLLISALSVAVISYRRLRAVSFFVLWFFITLSPSSSILPLRDVFAEHRLYLPSLGVFFIFASGILRLLEVLGERLERRFFIIISISLFISVGGALWTATYNRNRLWNSDIGMWQDAVRKSPKNSRAYNNLGVAYQDKGMTVKAIENYKIALRLNPDDSLTNRNLGDIYLKKGLFDKAVEHYKTALKNDPRDHKVYNGLGIAYTNLDMPDIAILNYQMALRLKPDYSNPHNELGIIYEKQGRFDEAVKEFDVAIRLKPDDSMYHINLGNAFYRQRRMDDAIRHYKDALRVKPDDSDGHNNLGYVYYEEGRLQDAEKEIKTALGINPDEPVPHFNLGLVYEKLERFDEAVEEFKKSLKLDPDFIDAHYHLGVVYLKMRLKEKARAEFEATLRLKPDHTQARQALNSIVR